MVRILIKLLLVPGCLMALLFSSQAQLRAPVTGNAQRWVQAGCAPCCFVTNLHETRPIQAVLFMMMSKHETRVEPRQTAQFSIRNTCATGAMGLEVRFAP
jgi:hypothetical protein